MNLCIGLTHAFVQGLMLMDGRFKRGDVRRHRGNVTARVPFGNILLVLLVKDKIEVIVRSSGHGYKTGAKKI